MGRFLRGSLTIAINVMILVVLLGAIEIYYRIAHPAPATEFPHQNGLWQEFHAYTMSMVAPGRHGQWLNRFTSETYSANVVTNSLGFNDANEFDYTKPYKKAANEKVVLFTGGSAGWGLGATSTHNTVAGRMQHYLNTFQADVKYTVINLSMGSWIAYQEFLALELWGERYDPDWIVVMDGHNDAGVGCGYSQGVANPLYTATLKSYVDGYLFSTSRPEFYRGWLENEVIRYSAAYRGITGKKYVPNNQVFDQTSSEENAIRRQIVPTKVGQSRDILAFYLKSIKAMLKLYPDAGYILSTQPMVNQFTGDFVDIYESSPGSKARRAAMAKRELDLEAYLKHHEDQPCGQKTAQPSFTYIFGNSAIQLERLAEDLQAGGRKVEYHNTGVLFPDARLDRMPYFIDPVHISDKGNDVLGRFYAERILAHSNGDSR